MLNLLAGAFLGAGHTARPDRISLPDAVTYGAFELAVASGSLAVGRVMAPLRGVWVCAAYAVCVLVTAMFGLALGLAIGEGYSWVAGSPCLPDQFCAVVPIRLGVGLRLGALLGAGLGLLQAFGLLAGDLLFHTLRARSARRHAPAPATPGPL